MIRFLLCTFTISLSVVITSGFTYHPWMQGRASIKPTQYDISIVENMTEWIQDDTTKLYIQSYLLLCPGQDMCFGNQYKRNHSFQLPFKSCDNCQCEHDCHRTNNCCPWRFYQQDEETTPDFISYKNYNQYTNSKYSNVPLKCLIPQVNYRSLKSSLVSYYMVSDCPTHYNDSVRIQRCEHSFQVKNVFLYQPYFSLLSNETFKNLECAICNGEPLDKLIPWSLKLVCAREEALFRTNNISYLQSTVFHDHSVCNVVFVPPRRQTQTRPCVVEQLYASTCNKTGLWKTFDSAIFNGCNSNFVDVYLDCTSAFERLLYKNVYCAMCNHDDWQRRLTVECKTSFGTYDWKNMLNVVSFSALIDFRNFGDVQPVSRSEDLGCPQDSLYEPRVDECIPIVCDEGMKTRNSECIPSHPIISQKYYEICLIAYPTSDHMIVDQKSIDRMRFFTREFIKTYNLDNYTCLYALMYHEDDPYSQKDYSYIAVSIQLSVGIMHRYKEFILLLSDELMKMDGLIVDNLVIKHIGQSFTTYFQSQGLIYRTYKNPMSDDYLIVDVEKKFFKQGPLWDRTCKNRVSVTATTIIAASSVCRKLVIDKRKFHVLIVDFRLYFVDFDFYVESQYFRESADKRIVEVCFEQYIEQNQAGKNTLVTQQKHETWEKYLSFICTTVSSAGCVGSLIVHIFIQKASSLPRYNMMALSLTLLLANIIYSVANVVRPYPTLCLVIGGATQFLWLEVLSLMSMSCFSIFRTFTSWNITKSDKRPKIQLLENVALSLIIPILMTVLNILVSRFFFLNENFGYSLSTCYIAMPELNLFTFAIPVAVMLILNIFMFMIIVREIRIKKNTPLSNTRKRHTIKIYCKLSTVTGTAWLLGYFYQIFQFRVLSYLHIIFTGSQGMFLFVAFALPILIKSKKWNSRDDASPPKS